MRVHTVLLMLREGHPTDVILTRIHRQRLEDETFVSRLVWRCNVWVLEGLVDLRDGKDRSQSMFLEVLPRLVCLLFRFVRLLFRFVRLLFRFVRRPQ
jgi:hypothetical protein